MSDTLNLSSIDEKCTIQFFGNVPQQYLFQPQKDITAFELAYIVHFFHFGNTYDYENYEAWDIIKRHFVEVQWP